MSTRNKAELWEEKYLGLRDEHEELKKQSNEQQRMLKQMYTKLQMIDGAMAKRGASKGSGEDGASVSISKKPVGAKDKETDALIASLRKENAHLRKVNLDLREKLRTGQGMTPGKKTPRMGRPGSASGKRTNLTNAFEDMENVKSHNQQQELVATLKKRLLGMEERMKNLHEQNNSLRRRLETSSAAPVPPSMSPRHSTSISMMDEGIRGNKDLISLQRDLKDKDAQILIVKNRYEQLQAKARAAAEIHERTVFMMEEGNRTIRDLRRKIQSLQHDNQQLVAYQERAEELELELTTSREENRKLEERMTALCESPFINDAFESRSRVDKLVALEKADRQQKVQIEHLKETAKMHHAEILALKTSAEQLTKQRDALGKENQELRLKLEQLQRGAGILEDKMRLYSGEAGVDSSELEKALTIVKRNQEQMGQVSFIESSMAAVSAGGAEATKQKLQELQVSHLNTCRELEMTERMLKAQTSINKDLNTEITELQERLKGSSNELHRKLEDYETLCAKRLQKIHALEAQVKQLMKKRHQGDGRQQQQSSAMLEDDAISLASLAASASDFGPGENLVEIWIVDAKLNEQKVEPGATTFVMIDFYDYETQTSPLLTGLNPAYNFAASYRVTCDHFFLRYLVSETLTLELNKTKHADYELLGQCTLSLRRLLDGSGKFKVEDAEIISVHDGTVVGTMKICVRLALPISDLFELYLREVPGERERLEKLKRAEEQENETVVARARAQNQLEITIESCAGLGRASGAGARPPCPFVHYQLLSFPDTFTSIVQNSTDPVFDQRVPFPVLVDNKLLRYLERERLEINVLDDSDEGSDAGDFDGVLGKAVISLAPLVKGRAISGSYTLHDPDGVESGSITIRIAWRSPLVSLEDMMSHLEHNKMELSEEQVRQVIKAFDVDGTVDWRGFLRLSVQSKANHAIQKLRNRLQRAFSKAMDNGFDVEASILHFVDDDENGEFTPKNLETALHELNYKISKEDLMLLVNHLDFGHKGYIRARRFLSFALPPNEVTQLCEKKMGIAFTEMESSGKDIDHAFEKREVGGLLSVRDFCKALHSLGFELMDRERFGNDPRDEPDFEHPKIKNNNKNAKYGDHHHAKKEEEEEDDEVLHDETAPRQQQDDIFEKRKLEFQQRIARAAQASADANVNIATNDTAERELILRTYGSGAETSAVKLQSQFRSFQSRKRVQGDDDSLQKSETVLDSILLVEAEDALKAALHRMDETKRSFDLREAFVKRDKDRTGFLNPGQFIRALSETRLGLMSSHATALANYFTIATESDEQRKKKLVDYNEFVRFARYQARDISGLSFHVRNATLHIQDDNLFRPYDKDNVGVVSRREFIKVLRSIPAMKSLSSYDLNALVDIFDVESTGEVDYAAFVKFATGQPMAVALKRVEEKLKDLVKRAIGKGVNLETSFAHFDRNGDGYISRSEFRQGLRDLKFDVAQKELYALYARLDPSRHGKVSYKEFVKFITSNGGGSSGIGEEQVHLENTKKRLQNIVRNALSAGLSIHGPFEHYDWKRSGLISKPAFERGCSLLGFPLTYNEQTELGKSFSDDGTSVNYRSFMGWVTPKRAESRDVIEKLRVLCPSLSQLKSTFASFDTSGKGEISRKDLRQGLEKLGMQLSNEELIALVNQFDRDGDGYIQYDEFMRKLTSDTYSSKQQRGNRKDKQAAAISHDLVRLREVLESHDDRFSGRIEAADFQQHLDQLGYGGGKVNVQNYLDADGKVLYKKFLKEQQGNAEYIDSVARKLRMMIENRAEAAGGDMHVPFEHFARSEDGMMTYASFKQGLEELGFGLSSSEVHALLDKFDLNGDGKVDFGEFVKTINSNNKNIDGANSPKRNNKNTMMMDPRVSNIMESIYYRGLRRGVNWRQVFKSYDKNGSGKIGQSEFISILQHSEPEGFGVEALSQVAEALDEESIGRVPYEKFLHCGDAENQDCWVLEEELRRMIMEQVELQGSLRVPFSHFDRKRKGYFDQRAWLIAVNDLALEGSESVKLNVFRRINLSGNGRVTFNEFALFVQDPDFEVELVRKIRKLILSLILIGDWDYEAAVIQKALGANDEDGSGLVDRHQVKRSLKKLGLVDLTREDIVRIIARFDRTGEEKADYQEIASLLNQCSVLGHQGVTISNKLRKLVREKMKEDRGFNMRQVFQYNHGSGMLRAREFVRQLMDTQLGLDEREASKLSDCFTFDSRLMDVDEFLQFFFGGFSQHERSKLSSPKASPTRSPSFHGMAKDEDPDGDDAVESILEDLRKLVKKAKLRGVDYHKSFEHFDKDYSGEISLKEFEKGMKELNFTLSEKVVKALYRKFAGSSRSGGQIKYRHFLRSLLPSQEAFMEEVCEKLRSMIRERAEYNGGGKTGLKKTFKHFRPDTNGDISRSAFRHGLEKLDFNLDDSEVRVLLDRFDIDGDGFVSFEEFRAFADGEGALLPESNMKSTRTTKLGAEVDEIANELRALIRKAHRQGVDYRQSFEHFDPHYSGYIDSSDFKRGLNKLGFEVSPQHVRVLLERFAGKDGRIRYRDFLKAVAPREEANAEKIADKFKRMLNRVGNLRKAFKHFERNRNGNITRKAFRKGMESLSLNLTDSEVRILMDIFDEDGDGEISFDEFVDFASRTDGTLVNRNSEEENDDEGGNNNEEGVSVKLNKLKIASPSSSIDRIYVQYKLPEQDEYVRTPAYPLTNTKRKQTVKMDHEKTIPVMPRSKIFKALKQALRSNRCKLELEIIGVKESGRSKPIAQAQIDLQDILEEMRDIVNDDISFYDDNDELIAKLNLSVKCLDILQTI